MRIAVPPVPPIGSPDEMYEETPDGLRTPSDALLRRQMHAYLGPSLASALWVKRAQGFDTDALAGRNVLIQNLGPNGQPLSDTRFNELWRSAVKSYLLNHAMRMSYLFCSGAKDVMDALYESYRNRDEGSPVSRYDQMETVQLLVLYLAGDPRNTDHAATLIGMLRKRLLAGRPTWVVTTFTLVPKESGFLTIYGKELTAYIKPRGANDPPGWGAGDFHLLDLSPISNVFRRVQTA